MKAVSIPHGLALAAPTEGYTRTSGLHMSDIYGALFKEIDPKRYDKRDKEGLPLPFDTARMELGTSFEEVLEPALAARLFGKRPGEFTTQEGIIYTPDYIFEIDGEFVLGEFKLTWMSTKGAPFDKKFDKYMCQIKSYLYNLGLVKCRLYVFFVNGDYTDHSPQLLAWELTFTQRELDANWAMMRRFALKRGILKI